MKALAIIPARGGSKRIPRKNIKNFAGQPIIQYSIDAALESGIFTEVMVSTDDNEIADIAKNLNAKVPFMRSEENSSDMAMTVPVLEEVIAEYKKLGQEFEYVCCIYPTAPFVTAERLKAAYELFKETKVEAVLPIMRFSYPIQRSLKMENGYATMFWPENYNVRSQDLEPAYHDCGQFYFLRVDSLLLQKVLYPKFTLPIIVPESEAQDIDSEEDWRIAEIKFKLLKKS
ncbi:pseudaminic acid cytidylyltransferase [bacterium]|nr:MAG: pseudaminic acid cytidylyltransferase [bacterium]